MKKTAIKILALALVVVMACVVFVSCGRPSGEYSGKVYTVKFSGSEVTVSWKGILDTYTMTGTFEMGEDEDGNKTISFEWPEGESYADDLIYGGAKAFFGKDARYNSGSDDSGDYIEINGARFDKK